MLLMDIDWSIGNIIKTGAFALFAIGNNFFEYTEIAPILIKMLVGAMIIDTLLGTRVAKKITLDYSSRKLRGGIYEKGLYLTVFLFLAYILKGLGLHYQWLPTTLFTILVVAEVISFLNHMICLKTGKISQELDLVTVLLKIIKGLFQYMADLAMDKLKALGSNKKSKYKRK